MPGSSFLLDWGVPVFDHTLLCIERRHHRLKDALDLGEGGLRYLELPHPGPIAKAMSLTDLSKRLKLGNEIAVEGNRLLAKGISLRLRNALPVAIKKGVVGGPRLFHRPGGDTHCCDEENHR